MFQKSNMGQATQGPGAHPPIHKPTTLAPKPGQDGRNFLLCSQRSMAMAYKCLLLWLAPGPTQARAKRAEAKPGPAPIKCSLGVTHSPPPYPPHACPQHGLTHPSKSHQILSKPVQLCIIYVLSVHLKQFS